MAPRTKRPRSNSSSQAETSSNKSPRTNPKPTPHDALWFDDGSIVLATDVHLYRVHKGVLARNSSVFKDMFNFPTSVEGGGMNDDATNAEEWDGVPMVKMAGDSDEDVYHLLMALYDREYHEKDKPTTLPIILALLNLSTKYDIPVIRQEVIRHLLIHFPSDQEKLDSDVDIPLFDENQETPKDVNFQLLASARRCNAGPILPMLFYTCAIEPLETIFEHITRFETEDFKRLIVGREQLISRWIQLFAKNTHGNTFARYSRHRKLHISSASMFNRSARDRYGGRLRETLCLLRRIRAQMHGAFSTNFLG
ncbi:hypothetical protein SCHPADRAFT_695050 [Schizopora paradoxa]|uniref:BTB domain-containing protein n=1 Tax=Schizopora paradoxa TaxID=27342 RepID=A0A0H2RN41_9AGAM|nr:hypothetical protein SCHPADRAFT_695050 [Schizopora paradoxa]